MFRFIGILIFLILYLTLTIPILIIEWILGKFNPHARDISSLRIVQWGFKVILRMSGVKATVIGEENIPDEPVLFIGNHRSYFDILLTYSRCKRLTGYIAKKEMERYLTLTTWMKRVSMNNTAEIFENHMPKVKKTHVVIEYGKPIYPEQLDKDTKRHIGDHVENIIRETIRKNAELV